MQNMHTYSYIPGSNLWIYKLIMLWCQLQPAQSHRLNLCSQSSLYRNRFRMAVQRRRRVYTKSTTANTSDAPHMTWTWNCFTLDLPLSHPNLFLVAPPMSAVDASVALTHTCGDIHEGWLRIDFYIIGVLSKLVVVQHVGCAWVCHLSIKSPIPTLAARYHCPWVAIHCPLLAINNCLLVRHFWSVKSLYSLSCWLFLLLLSSFLVGYALSYISIFFVDQLLSLLLLNLHVLLANSLFSMLAIAIRVW